ncbi:Putative cytochrome P450 superfamily [Colletotrichum destructivum]|uniref:Cytochrome P450 superfamily n=1 Tax=Colletotrichum destructivum TaxID=34406 RepID=A0AAX4I2K7_9PEZI|nr:Putative cytochrome P450 superfamily [Colletotrichum destructivum]
MYLKTKRDRDIVHRVFKAPAYAVSCIVTIAKGISGDCISQDAVKKIADDFYLVPATLKLVDVALSMYVPYTKGAVPNYIVDHWVLHMMESLTYTNAVAKELLRLRPPVIFVP